VVYGSDEIGGGVMAFGLPVPGDVERDRLLGRNPQRIPEEELPGSGQVSRIRGATDL
jgi:hypothetical protein